jgi:hypothetical protein
MTVELGSGVAGAVLLEAMLDRSKLNVEVNIIFDLELLILIL